MRNEFLEYIVCPACKGELDLKDYEKTTTGSISDGYLKCKYCGNDYPIIRGIPRLLLTKLSEFNKVSQTVWYSHWKRFGTGIGYDYKEYTPKELLSHGIIKQINPNEEKPLDLSLFKNKVVVDLGGGRTEC
jgi:uncharacterized protein YbaR (Trm112 family)